MRALVVVLVAGALLSAQDTKKPEKRKPADRQWIEGKIVCIGCTLENQEGGAEAQCTLYSKHAQGLLMADGTLWTLVNNARGHLVITNEKLRGKELKIFGWKWPRAQYIEVSKYQLKDGDTWIAYDYCKNCGFEKGDHKDKDLCDDCSEE